MQLRLHQRNWHAMIVRMSDAWQTWLRSLRTTTPTAWSRRQLAAAVEYTIRGLEARRLLADAPSEAPIIDALRWPLGATLDDRLAWSAGFPALGVQTMVLAWLATSARVLDDHGAALGDWPSYRDTVDGVAELSRRPVAPAPMPTPTVPPGVLPGPAPSPPRSPWSSGPYGRLGQSWPIASWTPRAALEALSWLAAVARTRGVVDAVGHAGTWEAVRGGGNPDARGGLSPALRDAVTRAIQVDTAILDAADVPLVPYMQNPDAWSGPSPYGDAGDGDAPDPDVVVRDLPTTPPRPSSPAATPAPAPAPARPSSGGGAGPYVLAFNRFRTWAAGENGLDGVSPRMTREQAAAVLRYVVRQIRTHANADDGLTRAWLPVALALLGWRQRGDTYRTDASWRTGWTPQPTIADVWAYALAVCQRLDALGVAFDGPHPAPTTDYAVMADEAKAAQLADDPTMAPPVTAPAGGADASGGLVPSLPPIVRPPPAPAPGGGGGTGPDVGVVLLALVLLGSEGL